MIYIFRCSREGPLVPPRGVATPHLCQQAVIPPRGALAPGPLGGRFRFRVILPFGKKPVASLMPTKCVSLFFAPSFSWEHFRAHSDGQTPDPTRRRAAPRRAAATRPTERNLAASQSHATGSNPGDIRPVRIRGDAGRTDVDSEKWERVIGTTGLTQPVTRRIKLAVQDNLIRKEQ